MTATKLCPKVILEGTRLTHKTDLAFQLNEHLRTTDTDALKRQVARNIEESVIFPTLVKFSGPLASRRANPTPASPSPAQ